jgi:hypothetical protein
MSEDKKKRVREATARWRAKNPGYKAPSQKDPEYMAAQRRKYLDKNPGYARNAALKHKYGITFEEKLEMLREQELRCKICNIEFNSEKHACVDHNHVTGEIRALLCNSCNLMIGMAKENTQVLLAAAAYLEKHNVL